MSLRSNYAEHLAEPSPRCVDFLGPQEAGLIENDLGRVDVLVRTLEPEGIRTDTELRDRIAEVFAFPDAYRDPAAEDGLKDLLWLPASHYLLRVPDSDLLWRTVPHAAGALVQRWLSAAQHWAARDVAFHLLFLPSSTAMEASVPAADPCRRIRTVQAPFDRPSLRCVHFLTASQSLDHDPRTLLNQDSGGEQVLVITMDGRTVHSDATLLARMGDLFNLPDPYAHSYETLRWPLCDLHWLEGLGHGYVLRIERAEALWRRAPEAAGALIEVWLYAAEFWHSYQTPFHLQFILGD